MKKIQLLFLILISKSLFGQISKETEKTLLYKEETKDYITKLNSEALSKKRPQIGNFDLSIAFYEKILSQKLNINDFYRHVYKYIENYEVKKYLEYNELTGEHDISVNEPEIILNYKGSKIIITLKSLKNDESPIYFISTRMYCKCDWFNITAQTKLNGYTQTEYSDKPDNQRDIFGGLHIKYKKLNKLIIYEKYSSKLYSKVSIEQLKPKNKKPTNTDEYLIAAKIRYKEGNMTEALANLNKSIELDKNNSEAYFFKGIISYNNIGYNKEYKEGTQTWKTMEFINKAIEIQSSNDKYYIKRGNLFEMIKEDGLAILDYKKAVELNPDFIKNHFELIDFYIKLKEYNSAIIELDSLIQKDPNNPELLVRRGIIKYENNDKCGGRKDCEKAKENGLNMEGRFELIKILSEQCNR